MTRILIRGRQEGQSERRRCDKRADAEVIQPGTKEDGQPAEAGQGKEWILPGPPERTRLCGPTLGFRPPNCKIINMDGLKPLHL